MPVHASPLMSSNFRQSENGLDEEVRENKLHAEEDVVRNRARGDYLKH